MRKQLEAHVLVAKILKEETGAVPDWIVLFKAGWNELEGGTRFLVDRKSFELLTEYVARRGLEVAFDYEHQTLTGGKAPAAGWIKEYRFTGNGIEARVDWTAEAAGYIARQEYRYFSPVFYVRASDQRVMGLDSVALTNMPKTNHLIPLTAKLTAEHQQTTEDDMDLKRMAVQLGLPETATEEEIIAAIDALKKTAGAQAAKEAIPAEVLAALDLKEGDASMVVASIHALRQNTKGMVAKADFDRLRAELAARDAAEAVDKALAAGKIMPDQKEWALEYAKRDLEGFRTFVAKAPVVVPMEKLPGGAELVAAKLLAGEVAKVAAMFGNTAEDLKKYGYV